MQDLSEFVTLDNETLVTDSRRVAKHFKKQHKNVLRTYDLLECSEDFRRLNFEPTMADVPGPNKSVRQERMVRMTKDGFMFLVMGFTGKEAGRIKEAYIMAFNTMANQLTRIQNSLWRQMLDLERRDASSQSWASFGSHCMLERKREKPMLENERALLNERIQPSLLN